MTKQHVQLTPEDRDTLTALTTQGDQKARRYKRALGWLELDRGKTYTAVAHTLGMTHQTLCTWAKKDHALGLACLQDAPRSGARWRLRASNAPKSPPWPVLCPRKAMASGPCGSWQIVALNKALVTGFPTHMSRRF